MKKSGGKFEKVKLAEENYSSNGKIGIPLKKVTSLNLSVKNLLLKNKWKIVRKISEKMVKS